MPQREPGRRPLGTDWSTFDWIGFVALVFAVVVAIILIGSSAINP